MTDTPLNPLETVIRDGMAGRATAAELHAAVLQSTLFVPSANEARDLAGLSPILLPTPRSETGMIAVFTDPSRITPEAAGHAPHCLQIAGSGLVALLATGLGVLVIAGPDAAAELDPVTLAEMRQSLLEQG
ncbi:SseB family protein [Sphingomonas sp. LB-2]|uniref:SseB family protein n=1 Tax=Sphingomonas caeni TaxID=2984949 RepID=UPI00223200A0|nr:SseB family protein [Sphingomonas caeni]MCW3846107.1 SseB family protein [Sphingomonas caeni]